MRTVLLFSIILLVQEMTKAQIVSNGLYVNEESKEFIYVNNDSIQFRLSNKDAFGSYLIVVGYCEFKGRNKYYVQSEDVGEKTSVVDTISREDSLTTIRILYDDKTPIVSAYCYLKKANDTEKDFEIIGISNTEGMIILTVDQIKKFNSNELQLKVEALGFSTNKKVVFKKGYEYIVYSVVPEEYPFTFIKSVMILINEINSKEIDVEIWRKKSERKKRATTKLFKVDTTEIPFDVFK